MVGHIGVQDGMLSLAVNSPRRNLSLSSLYSKTFDWEKENDCYLDIGYFVFNYIK